MLVTATEIKFRSPWAYILFLIQVSSVKRQLARAQGLKRFALSWNRTLTAWESEAHMKAFRNSGEHLKAMQAVARIGWAKSATWQSQSFPSWEEAKTRLSQAPFRG